MLGVFGRFVWRSAPALGALGLLLGCNSILGIDSASLDPNVGGASGVGVADAGASADAEAGPLLDYAINCDTYCAVIAANCQPTDAGDNTEFTGAVSAGAVCQAFCGQMVTSDETISATSAPANADTLQCHIYHANAASFGPRTHCAHAGPLGGNACNPSGGGDPCANFCKYELQFCTGDNQQYASLDDCIDACRPDSGYAGFPYLPYASADPNAWASDLASAGNTLNCRIYHLENVVLYGASMGAKTHCPHTSAGGGGVCVAAQSSQ